MDERSLCYTCGTVKPDAEVALCKRQFCTAQTALSNGKRGIRPPEKNPGEVIDYPSVGDAYDTWTL
jgi:hypothetical protein